MFASILISLYSVAVVASSLFGGWLPQLFRLTHVRMQLILSFVGGMMLGVGLLHMLPHSFVELGSLDLALIWMLVGLLGMFLLIRVFHFHEHGPAAPEDTACGDHEHATIPSGEPLAAHSHGAATGDFAGGANRGMSSISWIGVACGLSLHAFLDGIALGAGVISDLSHRGNVRWAGFGIFLAILLHKPLDALSITTLMEARDWSRRAATGCQCQLRDDVSAGGLRLCRLGSGRRRVPASGRRDCPGDFSRRLSVHLAERPAARSPVSSPRSA